MSVETSSPLGQAKNKLQGRLLLKYRSCSFFWLLNLSGQKTTRLTEFQVKEMWTLRIENWCWTPLKGKTGVGVSSSQVIIVSVKRSQFRSQIRESNAPVTLNSPLPPYWGIPKQAGGFHLVFTRFRFASSWGMRLHSRFRCAMRRLNRVWRGFRSFPFPVQVACSQKTWRLSKERRTHDFNRLNNNMLFQSHLAFSGMKKILWKLHLLKRLII